MKKLVFHYLLTPSLLAASFVCSSIGPATPTADAAMLTNLSARAPVRVGDDVLIGGFVVTGDAPRQVLLRAIGPSLVSGGIPLPACLPDPILTLVRQSDGHVIEVNDNWRDSAFAFLFGFISRYAPTSDLDAAMLVTLAPGAYTTIVSGKHASVGIGLVEIYDFEEPETRALINASARGVVRTGDDVLIGGFVVAADGRGAALPVIVRALGPSLAAAGVANPLVDPTLELYNSSGTIIASNDNWVDDGVFPDFERSGLAPGDERESVIRAVLPAGTYTAIVRGKRQLTGTALVEIYDASTSGR